MNGGFLPKAATNDAREKRMTRREIERDLRSWLVNVWLTENWAVGNASASVKLPPMKTTIPEELKKDVPQTPWGKILIATPVIMTIIATLLAGLASSEMTRAQYDRAFGAQLQSKAGDQWSYFQAKKLRSAIQHNSLELLQATADVHPLENPALEKIPSVAAPVLDANLQAALDVVEKQKPETEIAAALKQVKYKTLATALQAARDQAQDFDAALAPANQAIEQLGKIAARGRQIRRAGFDCRQDALCRRAL